MTLLQGTLSNPSILSTIVCFPAAVPIHPPPNKKYPPQKHSLRLLPTLFKHYVIHISITQIQVIGDSSEYLFFIRGSPSLLYPAINEPFLHTTFFSQKLWSATVHKKNLCIYVYTVENFVFSKIHSNIELISTFEGVRPIKLGIRARSTNTIASTWIKTLPPPLPPRLLRLFEGFQVQDVTLDQTPPPHNPEREYLLNDP